MRLRGGEADREERRVPQEVLLVRQVQAPVGRHQLHQRPRQRDLLRLLLQGGCRLQSVTLFLFQIVF